MTLWEALPEHLRADVTPEALERAAQEAPPTLRGDVRAVSLWAFLCVPEGGSVTAKRKTRGTVARLEALEGREAARREAVQAGNWAHLEAARAQLAPADVRAYRDAVGALEAEGDAGASWPACR
ncbi:hypothetical protein [Deinococcus aquaticus]|uniref:hypothetical protein n=1 Tax=Deinococcus aquaticus TaxID=328692 RepID=UPI0036203B20